ncbi:MAG: chromosomal replication initiator protein DnaA [Bacteroidales bacterium]|nr:chromosomal replication initiator protein DnaA [Bacteroidales bacterium]
MNDSEINELWRRCLRTIRDNVSEAQYNTWFAPIKPMKFENGTLTLGVPSPFFYDYLEEKFSELLACVLNKDIAKGTFLEYSVLVDKDNTLTTQMEGKTPGEIHSRQEAGKDNAPEFESHLIPNYVFDTFVKGRSNEYSLTVGEAVAQKPARTFNPLFIHGASGVGKTHLANAIGARIKQLYPEKRVLYISAHLFQVQYTESIRTNHFNDFMGFYQTVDVLIMDDLQEFAGAQKTQNTFFHIFNYLHQNGKQLVLTADRSPKDMEGMENRLLTRFKWGLVTELEKPDRDLRCDILRRKVRKNGLVISDDIIDYIADNSTEGVRELEGIINSILAQSIYCNHEINMELAQTILGMTIKRRASEISINEIIKKVCDYYHVSPTLIQSKSRKKDVSQARQVAMYMAKKFTSESVAKIGMHIGNRDHATVLHACKNIEGLKSVDNSVRASLNEIEQILQRA